MSSLLTHKSQRFGALLLALSLLGFVTPTQSTIVFAGTRCDSAVQAGLPQPKFLKGLTIPDNMKTKATVLAKEFGVDFSGSDYFKLINSVYVKISKARSTDLKKGNAMATFGLGVDKLLKDADSELRRAVWFTVGYAVTDLESFKESEYLKAPQTHPVISERKGLVHFDQFGDYAKGFIDGKAPYSNHKGWGEGSVIGVKEYRDIVMYNIWPVWMKGHDIFHVYFSYGHSKGTSLVFKSARGKNTRRFVMMAGIFEAVDDVQYRHEQRLAGYFEKKKIGLHDALLWVAKAPQAELDAIVAELGLDTLEQGEFEAALEGWIPSTNKDYKHGLTGIGLNEETIDYVATTDRLSKKPAEQHYMNYHRRADDTNGSVWDKDYMHSLDMTLNIGPETAPSVRRQPGLRQHINLNNLRLSE